MRSKVLNILGAQRTMLGCVSILVIWMSITCYCIYFSCVCVAQMQPNSQTLITFLTDSFPGLPVKTVWVDRQPSDSNITLLLRHLIGHAYFDCEHAVPIRIAYSNSENADNAYANYSDVAELEKILYEVLFNCLNERVVVNPTPVPENLTVEQATNFWIKTLYESNKIDSFGRFKVTSITSPIVEQERSTVSVAQLELERRFAQFCELELYCNRATIVTGRFLNSRDTTQIVTVILEDMPE